MSILRGLFIVAVASSAIGAQGRGRGGDSRPDKSEKAEKAEKADKPHVRTKYTKGDRDSDARTIVTWYGAHPEARTGTPGRGRALGHAIAPGWQKKLARNRAIPVAYRTYITPAPVTLVQMLPPVRSGWQYVVVDNQVMLIDRPTWKLIDLITLF